MAKSHSVVCKMVLIVAIAVVANLLPFSAGDYTQHRLFDPCPLLICLTCGWACSVTGQAAVPSAVVSAGRPGESEAECYHSSPTNPQCNTCCEKAGHDGGYVKGDVCLCNPLG